MSDKVDNLLKLIDITWKDIHHCRNQDWKFWVFFAACAAGLSNLEKLNINITCSMLGFGAFVAFTAAAIAWSHWNLLYKKSAYIGHLERMIEEINDKSAKDEGIPGVSYLVYTDKVRTALKKKRADEKKKRADEKKKRADEKKKRADEPKSSKCRTPPRVSGVMFALYVAVGIACFIGTILISLYSVIDSLLSDTAFKTFLPLFYCTAILSISILTAIVFYRCSNKCMDWRYRVYLGVVAEMRPDSPQKNSLIR